MRYSWQACMLYPHTSATSPTYFTLSLHLPTYSAPTYFTHPHSPTAPTYFTNSIHIIYPPTSPTLSYTHPHTLPTHFTNSTHIIYLPFHPHPPTIPTYLPLTSPTHLHCIHIHYAPTITHCTHILHRVYCGCLPTASPTFPLYDPDLPTLTVCACVRACIRACVRACVRACLPTLRHILYPHTSPTAPT